MINERLLPQPDIAPSGNLPSGYFNTVTYTGNGGTQKIGGYINRAAVFNGSNSTISTPITDNYSNLSISCWVKFNALPTGGADATLVSKGFYVSGSNTQYLQLRYEDFIDQFTFAIRQNNTYNQQATSGVTASVGVWYNVVGTLDSSGNAQIYVNGSAGTGTTSAPTMTNSDNFEIGSFANTVALLNGSIDQVRIFNKELSSTEVTTLYGETFASASKSVTDIFSDGSAVALYQLDGNANDTGGLDYVFTTWDSTLSSVPNYSEGNLRMTGGSGNKIGYSVDSVSSGKWYWEHEVIAIGAESSFGIARPGDLGSHYVVGTSSTSWGLYVNGNLYHNGSVSTSGYMSGGFSNGDIIGVELDLDNGTLEFYKNGTGYGNAFTGLSGKFLVAAESRTSSGNNDHRTNFGSTAWDYTPSTGFAGINTEYNGTASNVTYQEATNFSPDLVWIKDRDTNYAHQLYDTVRGVTKKLHPNTTAAEATDSTGLTSFDSNGFTISTNVGINTNNNDYVSWCFNAGGSPTATNSAGAGNVPTAGSVKIDGADLTTALAGTIPATKISANQKAGFSIVKYTGVNSNSTVGHGLSSAPEIRIIKGLSTGTTETQNWFTWVAGIGTNNEMILNGTGVPAYTASVMNQNQTPTSTIFPIGFDPRVNQSGKDYIAYCFHSVDGIQKVGNYTGTGASGNLVETGFEPAFILFKRTDSGDRWLMADNKRADALTNMDDFLDAQDSAPEGTFGATNGINFLSNGFSINTTDGVLNANNGTYIYLAIAADPDTTTPTVENSFDVVTYTGNGGTQSIDTDFKPDLIWVKERTNASHHALFDSVRGNQYLLSSNQTIAEIDQTANPALESFNTNGFTVDQTNTSNYYVNRSSQNYVAWCWKAGDHDDNLPQINTEGSIDSVVSVNDEAGFSIVKYTGNGTQGATVGHSLSSPPELIIWKNTDATANWLVYSPLIGSDSEWLYLNATSSKQDSGSQNEYPTNKTNPTSDVVTINGAGSSNNINISGESTIMYCFTSITGYQKVGSYTGTGVSGLDVSLSFSPRFLLVKGVGSTGWILIDSQRGSKELYANLSDAEDASATAFVLGTNKFTVNSTGTWHNSYDVDYIYLAIK